MIPQSDGSVVAQGYIYRPSIKAFLGQGSVTNALYANEAAYPIYPTLNIVYGAVNVGCIKQTTATNSAPNAGTCSTGFSSPWQLNNADPTYTIAFDGTETRQALKTNTATRGGDNNYVYDYALVRQDSARLSAGDTSIVTTSFLTPGTGMNYQRYYQGWAYSPNFNDINASTVGYTTGKTNWALLLYIQSNVLYYYDHTGTLNSVYAALAVGDQIIGTLIPNSSAGADLQITVYRPSIGAVIFSTYYINALTSTEASHPVYAAVLPITGAVNLSCIGSGLGSLPSVGGTAGSNQTICPGSTPSSNLTLSGNTGSVVKWQYSVDNFVSDVHDIASSASTTLTTAQMGALADTTYYRAVVQNAGSATAYSSIDTITVNVSVGGMASPNQAVCSGSSPSNLTLTGKGGSVIKWQYSSDNFASDVHDIASSASTTLTTGQMGALSATTYYRAVVQAGSCAVANSSIDTVIANVASVGGTTGSNQIVITGNAPLSNLTVTNYTGSVVKWQYSNNNFSSDVHDIPSSASPTLTTAQIGPVSTIQYYRASVKNGACPASNSSITVLDTLSLLPLHWLSLSATWAPPAVNVVWLSADEKQIDHYEVFRSGNGSSFELAGKMAVMKNSAATNKYSFADLNASSVSTDKLFYYVVAVNDDGGRDVSNIVTVKINNLPEKIMLYPNPTNGKIYFSSLKDVSTINIYSATGSLVRQIQNVSQGNLTYDLSMLASGFYIVHLIRNSGDPVSLNVSLIK